MNIQPLRDKIFVLPDKVIDRTDSGLILTDYSKKRPTSGTIIAIGSQIEDFKVGNRIIYGEFAGHRQIINYNNEDTEIFIMTPADILALLK